MKSKVRLYGFTGPFLSWLEGGLEAAGFCVSRSNRELASDEVAINLYPLQASMGEGLAEAISESLKVVEAVKMSQSALVSLDDYRAFEGGSDLTWDEDDHPESSGTLSSGLSQIEASVSSLPRGVVLRFSWLMDGPNGLLSSLLDDLCNEKSISYSAVARGCPTSQGDMVRVLTALLRQICCGIEVQDRFHYCSGDVCSLLDFATATREVLVEKVAFPLAEIQESEKAEPVLSAVLSCARVRDVFGVQQRSWRQELPELLDMWVAHRK